MFVVYLTVTTIDLCFMIKLGRFTVLVDCDIKLILLGRPSRMGCMFTSSYQNYIVHGASKSQYSHSYAISQYSRGILLAKVPGTGDTPQFIDSRDCVTTQESLYCDRSAISDQRGLCRCSARVLNVQRSSESESVKILCSYASRSTREHCRPEQLPAQYCSWLLTTRSRS